MNVWMTKLLLGASLVASASVFAADNPLLDNNFWKNATHDDILNEITQGSSVTDITDNQYTPLLLALRNKATPDTIHALVQAGADVNRIGHDGRTALFYAAQSGDISLLTAIVRYKPDVTVLDDGGRNALLYSMNSQPSADIIETLLKLGLDINAVDSQGRNAALIAVQRTESADYLNYLKSLGVDLSAIDNSGRGLLLNAAYRNANLEVIKELGTPKQWKKVSDSNKQNALHVAAYRNDNVEVMRFLMEAGISATAEDAQGNTPLLISVERNSAEVIDFFLGQKNSVNVKNDDQQTALLVAVNRSANNEQRLQDNETIIAALLKAGAKADVIDGNKNSALHYAIRSQQSGHVIKQLIDADAPVNQVNKDGLTALMQAALVAKQSDVIELLFQHNADASIADDFGDTAWALAQDNPHLKDTAALSLLQATIK